MLPNTALVENSGTDPFDEWGELGRLSDVASKYLDAAGGIVGFAHWPAALLIIGQVDTATSGALLGSGRVSLLVDGDVLNNAWVSTAVAGRLAAVSAVGAAAWGILTGKTPGNGVNTQDLASSFVQNSRRGDSALADLDAALLGLSIAMDATADAVTGGSLLKAVLTNDAATIAASLSSYTALNAWSMLEDISPNLEGL